MKNKLFVLFLATVVFVSCKGAKDVDPRLKGTYKYETMSMSLEISFKGNIYTAKSEFSSGEKYDLEYKIKCFNRTEKGGSFYAIFSSLGDDAFNDESIRRIFHYRFDGDSVVLYKEGERELSYLNINAPKTKPVETNTASASASAEPQEHIKDHISYIALPYYYIKFSDSRNFSMSISDNPDEDGESYEGTYTLDVQDNITFVNVTLNDRKKERFLLLADNVVCMIYDSGGKQVAFGMSGSMNRANVIDQPGKVSASSYLKDGGVSYPPENISDWDKTDKPWVEGVDGYGIGEKITFIGSRSSFHISIGYVSYKKPYLYTQNSRPKKIRVSADGLDPIVVELKDTPQFQQVMLPEGYGGEMVLEILDVYPGTKYKDTCINSIVCDGTDPRNYRVYEYWEEIEAKRIFLRFLTENIVRSYQC